MVIDKDMCDALEGLFNLVTSGSDDIVRIPAEVFDGLRLVIYAALKRNGGIIDVTDTDGILLALAKHTISMTKGSDGTIRLS